MKKYKKSLFILPLKLAFSAIGLGVGLLLLRILRLQEEDFVAIKAFVVGLYIIIFLSLFKGICFYRYFNNHIQLTCLNIPLKRIKYSEYNSICISNAAYNNHYGGIHGNIPMYYTVRNNGQRKKIVCPFITLLKQEYPVSKIRKGMSSRDLYFMKDDEIYCLGVCWFDSLTELLNFTDVSVYVLEDVYLRFKEKFDSVFEQYSADRFYIIADKQRRYNDYLKSNYNM